MLKKIVIKNYKVFHDFVLELNPGMNVIVDDNDVGKSNRNWIGAVVDLSVRWVVAGSLMVRARRLAAAVV